jgi:predicted nuclease of predicted toxin-antitoxin system
VKLLLDQNLSRFLIAGLDRYFVGSVHVGDIGLDRSTDREIWDWAGENDFTIVSKDSDFCGLASVFGPPPKVIWLRVGNASTDVISEVLTIHVDRVMEFGRISDEALLVVDPTQPIA